MVAATVKPSCSSTSGGIRTETSRQATNAKITASGSEPPAYPAPAGIEAAIAAPGAMPVIDWKSTSRRPIALRRSPGGAGLAIASIVTFAAFAESSR